jgi:acyl dehydratase
MSKDIPFESIELHELLGPVEVHASEKAVQRYCEDWDDRDPLYLSASPYGEPIVPPAYFAGLTGFQLLSTRYAARATIGAKTEHRNLAPAFVGARLITRGSVVEKYVRRGLEYVVVESHTHDQNARPIRTSRDVILLGLERRADTEDDARARASSRPPVSPLTAEAGGQEIPSTRKRAYQRALDESRFASNSIHNDEYTRRHGYAGALMSAYVLCGYMSEPLVKFFGLRWFEDGSLALNFINGGVQQGDAITCRGRVTKTSTTSSGERHELTIWMQKDDGTCVVSGHASGTRVLP